MKTQHFVIAGIVVIVAGLYFALILWPKRVHAPIGVVCTAEGKSCPDGSYVGRTGPKCEFAPCPGEGGIERQSMDTSNWKTYRNEKYGFEFKYPEYLTEKENYGAKFAVGPIDPKKYEGSLVIDIIPKPLKGYIFTDRMSLQPITPEKVTIHELDFYVTGTGDAGCSAKFYHLPKDNFMIMFWFSRCENMNPGVWFLSDEDILQTVTLIGGL